MPGPTNGHVPPASGAITRTPSFAPISPVVKERVGEVAARLSDVEGIIDNINLLSAKSTTRSPTVGDLQQEIVLLKKEIEGTRSSQKRQIDGLKNSVKVDLKDQVTRGMQAEIERKIKESVEAQVRIAVGEWGNSEATKGFVNDLNNVIKENDALCQDARIKLDNSRSRHENSTLDEHADFETSLSKIILPDGNASETFPRTMKALFSYDEKQLLQLCDDYGLQRLDTHLENLNRFLAFIGLRFSIPEQSLDFLENPPEYTSPTVLESPKEENPSKVSPVPPKNQTEENPDTSKVQPEPEKPSKEPTAVNDKRVQVRPQEQQAEKTTNHEEDNARQDRTVQEQGEIELSNLAQPHTLPRDHGPQQTSPTRTARPANHVSIPHAQPPPQPFTPRTGEGVTGWPQQSSPTYTVRPNHHAYNPRTQPPPQPLPPRTGEGVTGWLIKSLAGNR